VVLRHAAAPRASKPRRKPESPKYQAFLNQAQRTQKPGVFKIKQALPVFDRDAPGEWVV